MGGINDVCRNEDDVTAICVSHWSLALLWHSL